jgi:molybdenum cofactor guanylyltransferase
MGTDKTMLVLDGRTLLDRALELARSVSGDVRVVGPRERFPASLRPVEDIFPDHGPLGGIHAALAASSAELNLVLAVDCPFIAPEFLRFLVAEARRSQAVVTLARSAAERGGRKWESVLHPLCAVYRRAFVPVAERALRDGRNKIEPLLADVATRVISPEELEEHAFSPEMFRNLNTPADLEQARRL